MPAHSSFFAWTLNTWCHPGHGKNPSLGLAPWRQSVHPQDLSWSLYMQSMFLCTVHYTVLVFQTVPVWLTDMLFLLPTPLPRLCLLHNQSCESLLWLTHSSCFAWTPHTWCHPGHGKNPSLGLAPWRQLVHPQDLSWSLFMQSMFLWTVHYTVLVFQAVPVWLTDMLFLPPTPLPRLCLWHNQSCESLLWLTIVSLGLWLCSMYHSLGLGPLNLALWAHTSQDQPIQLRAFIQHLFDSPLMCFYGLYCQLPFLVLG